MYATAEETSQLSEWCKEHSGVGSPSSCFSTETLIEQWFCLEDGTVILPREEFPREAQTESSCIYIGNKINFTLLHQSFPQTSLTLCHKNCFSPWFLPWGEGSDIGWSVCLNVWPPGFWGHTLWSMFLILFHTECWVIIRAWSPGISTKRDGDSIPLHPALLCKFRKRSRTEIFFLWGREGSEGGVLLVFQSTRYEASFSP